MSKEEQHKIAMNEAIQKLVATLDTPEQAKFAKQMEGFNKLFQRFLKHAIPLEWDHVKTPSAQQLQNYSDFVAESSLSKERIKELLSGLVVLKLNGGLGTTMGCTGPKSVIEVRNGQTFLDLIVKQIRSLNETYGVNVPLVLMNSFNTDQDTAKIIQKYDSSHITILTFQQKQYPRILKHKLVPLPTSAKSPNNDDWYPPGHGDVYESFVQSDLYKTLLAQGKKYVFMSNVDNLGATVDVTLLNHLEKNGIEFAMEVTKKTRADVKGGTLIDYKGTVKLLEIASVPKDKVEEFKSIKKFKIFNTNNLWVSLPSIETHLDALQSQMDIIVNNKTIGNGVQIVQLETAAGAAIQVFNKACGVVVDRSRFLPVKACSDLLMIQSNLYSLHSNGTLALNPERKEKMGDDAALPQIKLSAEFNKVNDYLSRFETIPNLLELESLTVAGDVKFGAHVTLRGNVIVMAQPLNARLDIPSGAVLENKIVNGGVRILDLQ